ncbi:MAG: VTT domain-containing protein [Pseudomonadota bacterium]
MPGYLRPLSRLLVSLDARTATSVWLSAFILILVAAFVLLFGPTFIATAEDGAVAGWFEAIKESPFALLAVVLIYSALAFVGFPQFLLIAVTVVSFGAIQGAAFSWIATMVSAAVTFALGWVFGSVWVSRLGGDRTEKLVRFLNEHGILASAAIRIVPSAPFIVVNGAAGAARIEFWKYAVGTGAGIVPKISLVATIWALAPNEAIFSGGMAGVVDFFRNVEPSRVLALLGLFVGWSLMVIGIRAVMRRFVPPDTSGSN